MNTLILGGSGFLSSHLARHALALGHNLSILTRGQRPLPPDLSRATQITADRKNLPAFAAAIAAQTTTYDLVIDSICFDAPDAQQLVDIFPSRAKHLVMISTEMVCSPINRPWKIDETFDRWDTAPYGKNKRAAEEILLANSSKLPFTILRPNHIYGPGSQLGCLPHHGRDPQLIAKLRDRQPLKLIGGGHFLQQPVFAPDLALLAFACHSNPLARNQIYFAPGPDVLSSRTYYEIIADILNVPITIEESSIAEYLAANPTNAGFCCHRVYSTDKGQSHNLPMPATPARKALELHVHSLLNPT